MVQGHVGQSTGHIGLNGQITGTVGSALRRRWKPKYTRRTRSHKKTRVWLSQIAIIVVITASNENSIIIVSNDYSILIIVVVVVVVYHLIVIIVRRLRALQALLVKLPGDDGPDGPAEMTLGIAA